MVQAPADADPPSREDYARIVEDLDKGVGEILDTLRKQSLAENTLVVFMSDNGGEWLSRNAPFFHRKNTLWEGGIRVPAIFRWPGIIPAGKTLSQVGITMDVTATVLSAAGATRPGGGELEGIDLLPILREGSTPVERTLFWRNASGGGRQRAVRSGDWKLLIDGEQQLLFDVTRDPGERDDQAARYRDRVQTFKQLLDAWERDVDAEAKSRVSRPR
jgi:arylsulfatase A-like enzyme